MPLAGSASIEARVNRLFIVDNATHRVVEIMEGKEDWLLEIDALEKYKDGNYSWEFGLNEE